MCNQIKKLEIGKFYLIHDGNKTGHPGFIVWKDDTRNIYIAIKFGTTKNKNNIPLQNKIDNKRRRFIYKRLFVGRRKDFGKIQFEQFVLTDEVVSYFRQIKENNLVFSTNVSSNDKKFSKFVIKFIEIKK